jgi:exopolyphosphatase/guanosine-5'-triphosphate,3'-diphosphate pyrophosphatase
MEEFEVAELSVSDRGLREGLIVDYMARSHPNLLREMTVRERSVLRLGRACGFDEPHARAVAGLATGLFDSARELRLHKYGERERELLGHAAMLHDIGALLSYTDHHRHTYYLIRNADLLGFDQTEIETVAAIARFHRKGYPRKQRPEFASLGKKSRRVVRPLAVFLRLAENLDRSHAGLVSGAALRELPDGTIALELACADECHLELWGAEGNSKVFERAFGRPLVVRANLRPSLDAHR